MNATITGIERLTNSRSGNPRFCIHYEGRYADGGRVTSWANTAADHSYNYEIGNKGLRVGDVVEIEMNGRGTIKSISPAPNVARVAPQPTTTKGAE